MGKIKKILAILILATFITPIIIGCDDDFHRKPPPPGKPGKPVPPPPGPGPTPPPPPPPVP